MSEFDFFNNLNFGTDFTKQGLAGYGTYTDPYNRPVIDTPDPVLIEPTGIETIPGPIEPFINQGGDDGIGITTISSNDGFGGGYKSPYEDENVKTYLEDIAEGTIDYGDQKILNKMKLEDLLKKTPYYLLNSIIPFSGSLLQKHVEKKKIEKVLEEARIKREEEQIIADAAAEEQATREAATAARARAANPNVYASADAQGFTSGGGGFASQNTGTNENFSNNTGRGRTGYGTGGIVTL